MPDFYGDLYAPIEWEPDGDYRDIPYETAEGIAKITICRPEVRNAFRPQTLFELADAFNRARDDAEVGVIILTGAGRPGLLLRRRPAHPGRRRLHRRRRRRRARASAGSTCSTCRSRSGARPSRWWPWSAGYAIGGGHVLHVVCDLTIAADNARFGQTGPKVGSFDGGYGSGLLARNVGQKKAREIWFLCDVSTTPRQALDMGLVNTVVPLGRPRGGDGGVVPRDAAATRRWRCGC